jgi:hypothetical protein
LRKGTITSADIGVLDMPNLENLSLGGFANWSKIVKLKRLKYVYLNANAFAQDLSAAPESLTEMALDMPAILPGAKFKYFTKQIAKLPPQLTRLTITLRKQSNVDIDIGLIGWLTHLKSLALNFELPTYCVIQGQGSIKNSNILLK